MPNYFASKGMTQMERRASSSLEPACIADSQEVLRRSPRTNVLGVGVSLINMKEAIRLSDKLIQSNSKGYICATDVHTIIEAQSDSFLRGILNRSFLTTPDGMPIVWVARLRGFKNVSRVYGPDFMLELCRHSVSRGYRHFLFGGNEGVADDLRKKLTSRFPGLQVVGTFTPPYRALNAVEERDLETLLAETMPDIFWVGLGSPKQERFMAEYYQKLNTKLMVGVGAAFDFHSGRVKEAPEWLKETGFQWAYRLIREPRRLWKRYLNCVPRFIVAIALQLSRIRRYEQIEWL